MLFWAHGINASPLRGFVGFMWCLLESLRGSWASLLLLLAAAALSSHAELLGNIFAALGGSFGRLDQRVWIVQECSF